MIMLHRASPQGMDQSSFYNWKLLAGVYKSKDFATQVKVQKESASLLPLLAQEEQLDFK